MKFTRSQLERFLPDNEAIRLFEEIARTADNAEKAAGTFYVAREVKASTSTYLVQGLLPVQVAQNQIYKIDAFIVYDVDGAAGTAWSISGPASSLVVYRAEYSLTGTSTTVVNSNAYMNGAVNASSGSATGNIATISGIVATTDLGILSIANASASGEIRIQPGSYLQVTRLT